MSIDGPKKSRGRPRVDSEPVKLRIEREVLDALDVYLKRHPILRNRQMAIMSLIEEALVGAGLLQDNTMRIGLLLFAERKGLAHSMWSRRRVFLSVILCRNRQFGRRVHFVDLREVPLVDAET